jgi:hypothetical protein
MMHDTTFRMLGSGKSGGAGRSRTQHAERCTERVVAHAACLRHASSRHVACLLHASSRHAARHVARSQPSRAAAAALLLAASCMLHVSLRAAHLARGMPLIPSSMVCRPSCAALYCPIRFQSTLLFEP